MRTLELHENEKYRFNAEKAERAIRFIEKYCRTSDTGGPFTLCEWETLLVRTLFGWVHRDTGLRRFRELYLLTAKGSGKTPLLTVISLFCLTGEGEKKKGVEVVSCAADFTQAKRLSFGDAQRFVRDNTELSKVCENQQYQIKGPRDSHWTVLSGKPKGRSGFRFSVVLADELHEMLPDTWDALRTISANLFKRPESLLLTATNAGEDRIGDAWQKHERALKVLDGKSQEESLLPFIFEAPESLPWHSREAAQAANPSLGTFIQFEQLTPKIEEARHDPAAEMEYRRLYLSQWRQAGKKWIDIARWDACCQPFTPPPDATLYVGVDLSNGDDLCATLYVYVTAERFYIDSEYWLPRVTAEYYQGTAAHPYTEWAEGGHIHLLDQKTIDDSVSDAIAKAIEGRKKTHPIKAVCYDPFHSSRTVAMLESSGITCVPIRQGYSLSPGADELYRRLIDGTITIQPNPVTRAHAETVEVVPDSHGNKYPVKPKANTRTGYAGRVSKKIDGIAALVTALVEARKHTFPTAKRKPVGIIEFIKTT